MASYGNGNSAVNVTTESSAGFQASIPGEIPPATATSVFPFDPFNKAQALLTLYPLKRADCFVYFIVVQSKVNIPNGSFIPDKKTVIVALI